LSSSAKTETIEKLSTRSAKFAAETGLKVRKIRHLPRLAHMILEGQKKGVPCTIRDLTETGAVVSLGGWIGIPDNFHLSLEPDGRRISCNVVAKKGSAITVRFTD
jgi:hypothetical protein